MPISLSEQRTPALKLPSIGDTVVVAIAHHKQEPLYEYRTDGAKIRAKTQDGKERSQLKLTVVVVSGKAITGQNDEPVAPGEEAVIYLSGHNWFSFIEADKELGGVNVGDVMQWKFEREEPGKGREKKRIRSTTLRRSKPSEADTVAKCEAIYRRLTATPLNISHNGNGFDDSPEEPF